MTALVTAYTIVGGGTIIDMQACAWRPHGEYDFAIINACRPDPYGHG
jgi:hypothetical protein